MGCQVVKMPSGGNAFVCGPTARCKCGSKATALCDWKVPTKKSGTCDAKLCAKCSYEPAPDKDLCAKHAKEWLVKPPNPKDQSS